MSGKADLNRRPLGPEPSALPSALLPVRYRQKNRPQGRFNGSDGACLPFANLLFAHSRPPPSPNGGIHAAFSSYSLGGDYGSSPLKHIDKKSLAKPNFYNGSDGA